MRKRPPMNRGPGSTGPAASRGRILIIEDDPEAALFAMHVLGKREHFDVTHTLDPAAAIGLAAAEHWDLVLTDMELPGMTFAVLLDELRRVAPGVPVVVLSAHVEIAELGRRAEAFLSKPVRIEQLIATVSALIERTGK
jgi:DNA-binding response OmpR family regulator